MSHHLISETETAPLLKSIDASSEPLLWTCNGCGADYDMPEMQKAIRQKRDGTYLLICTVCGREGDFVDGPDAIASRGWFLVMPDKQVVNPHKERRTHG